MRAVTGTRVFSKATFCLHVKIVCETSPADVFDPSSGVMLDTCYWNSLNCKYLKHPGMFARLGGKLLKPKDITVRMT
ncbi:hypothetical protein MKX03_002356 [Papaver bracteatum]|nr:hypothetical protein MKX03_002356 [Papaver bracteatum]